MPTLSRNNPGDRLAWSRVCNSHKITHHYLSANSGRSGIGFGIITISPVPVGGGSGSDTARTLPSREIITAAMRRQLASQIRSGSTIGLSLPSRVINTPEAWQNLAREIKSQIKPGTVTVEDVLGTFFGRDRDFHLDSYGGMRMPDAGALSDGGKAGVRDDGQTAAEASQGSHHGVGPDSEPATDEGWESVWYDSEEADDEGWEIVAQDSAVPMCNTDEN